MTVTAQKTKQTRVVPIEADLYSILLAALEAAPAQQPLIVTAEQVNRNNRRVRFHVIVKRAGLAP